MCPGTRVTSEILTGLRLPVGGHNTTDRNPDSLRAPLAHRRRVIERAVSYYEHIGR